MPTIDGARPPRPRQSARQRDLAARYAPLIHFDRNEPFLPLVVGYTVFTRDGSSPSFERAIALQAPGRPPAAFAIEYAIWWDWDIQHLYELEHTWTYVGADGAVVYAEASWHGDYAPAVLADRRVPVQDGHPVVYSQPGKHAFVPSAEPLLELQTKTALSCTTKAGSSGLLVKDMYQARLGALKTEQNDAAVAAYLKARAFMPASVWDKDFLVTRAMLVPWPALSAWIPARIAWVLDEITPVAR